MGRMHLEYLPSCRVYCCNQCQSHLTTPSEIISKAFQSSSGQAYLFDKVVNVCEGKPITRQMTTGTYVCYIYIYICVCVCVWYACMYNVPQKEPWLTLFN